MTLTSVNAPATEPVGAHWFKVRTRAPGPGRTDALTPYGALNPAYAKEYR
jgi:hypothetical protein